MADPNLPSRTHTANRETPPPLVRHSSPKSTSFATTHQHKHDIIIQRTSVDSTTTTPDGFSSSMTFVRLMHPALLISEIIAKIFSHFVLPADRHTLISLACTCQAFYDIASDCLWRDIRGLNHFSKMLFPDPIHQIEDVLTVETWRSRTERFQAYIAERERLIALGLDVHLRDRVLSCAHRVRRISMGPSDMNDPETYTFFAFVAAYPPDLDPTTKSRSVFPNLRRLQCTLTTVHGVTHAVHLIQLTSGLWNDNVTPRSHTARDEDEPAEVSNLRSLEISAFVPWTYQSPAQTLVNDRFLELAKSFRTLTRLERLDFRCDQLGSNIELAFVKALKHLTALRHVSLGFKKHGVGWAVTSLSGHQHLRECQIMISREDVPGGLEPHPDGPFAELLKDTDMTSCFSRQEYFPAMEVLHVTGKVGAVMDAIEFFELPPSLVELHLHLGIPTEENLTRIMHIVSARSVQLKTFVISDTRMWMNKRTYSSVNAFTIKPVYPMLELSHLEVVVIDIDVVYHLSDDDLATLANSWPGLKKLHISPWKDVLTPNVKSLPSFWGLKTLLEGCPKMEELKLKIDATRDVHGFVEKMTRPGTVRVDSNTNPARIYERLFHKGDTTHLSTSVWTSTVGSSSSPLLPSSSASSLGGPMASREENPSEPVPPNASKLKVWFIGASLIEKGQAEIVAEAIHALLPNLATLSLPREVTGHPWRFAEWTVVHDTLLGMQMQSMVAEWRRRAPFA
ncbi:hypothetical protein FRB99_006025 [Tulasnella sp. 403]|nr:hypothetical protein FRB99_006025 [Tulasnella sp. 403]